MFLLGAVWSARDRLLAAVWSARDRLLAAVSSARDRLLAVQLWLAVSFGQAGAAP